MAMNRTNPADLFGGTWEQIKDRFLLADGTYFSGEEIGYMDGYTQIPYECLPNHTHTFKGVEVTDTVDFRRTNGDSTLFGDQSSNGYLTLSQSTGQKCSASVTVETGSNYGDQLIFNYTPTGTISSTGKGHVFFPTFILVSIWYRTA